MWKPYTPEEKEASNKYSALLQRSKKKNIPLQWGRKDFINWYMQVSKTCYHCGCTEHQIKRFYELNNSKRKTTQGKTFEVDRLRDESYSQNNCVLSCYWCNNAKSDVFTSEEFKPIGKAIGGVIGSIIEIKGTTK